MLLHTFRATLEYLITFLSHQHLVNAHLLNVTYSNIYSILFVLYASVERN